MLRRENFGVNAQFPLTREKERQNEELSRIGCKIVRKVGST